MKPFTRNTLLVTFAHLAYRRGRRHSGSGLRPSRSSSRSSATPLGEPSTSHALYDIMSVVQCTIFPPTPPARTNVASIGRFQLSEVKNLELKRFRFRPPSHELAGNSSFSLGSAQLCTVMELQSLEVCVSALRTTPKERLSRWVTGHLGIPCIHTQTRRVFDASVVAK